jgi:5-methylthioadenosine/S-adenosylhomocysteine deaminase
VATCSLHGAARAATELGNRLVTVDYVGAHRDQDYLDTLDDSEWMLREWSGAAGGRIVPWVGLEHPFYADRAGQQHGAALAREDDTGFCTPCSEAPVEMADVEGKVGPARCSPWSGSGCSTSRGR